MQEEPDNQPPSNWQFSPETQTPAPGAVVGGTSPEQPTQPAASNDTVSWTASEFISHEKNIGWYLLLVLGGGFLALAISLLTHDIFSGVMVAIVAIALGFFASRQPRTLPYQLD